jgi:hypothetical protein
MTGFASNLLAFSRCPSRIGLAGSNLQPVVFARSHSFDARITKTLQTTPDRLAFRVVDSRFGHYEDIDLPERLFLCVRGNHLSEDWVVTGKTLECLDVSLLRAGDHLGWEFWAGGLMIPPR